MSEGPQETQTFERGGERRGPAYLRRVLQVLRSENVYVDFVDEAAGVSPHHIKAEMYAIAADLIERSFPHVEKWISDHPNAVVSEEIIDGEGTGRIVSLSFDDVKSSLRNAETDSNLTPEAVFSDVIHEAVQGLIFHALAEQAPNEVFVEGHPTPEGFESEMIHGESESYEEALGAQFGNLMVNHEYRSAPVTLQQFVSEGAGTAGFVMGSMAMVAPILSAELFGDIKPDHVKKCREGMYGLIADLTAVHLDKFNFFRSNEELPDPHTINGIMRLIDFEEIDGVVKCSLHDEFRKYAESLRFENQEGSVREDVVRCPAMYALSSDGVVNLFLWNYVSDVAAATFDQAVTMQSFAERQLSEFDEA